MDFSNLFSTELQEYFSESVLQKIAGQTGFYKRKCNLTPAMFFELLLLCATDTKNQSLENISTKAKELWNLQISKQSIDGRFTEEAVLFVKTVLAHIIENEISKVIDSKFLCSFNYVRIKDSTKFNLPSRLAKYYKGCGGNVKHFGGISIQYEYDIKSGKVLQLDIGSSSIPDSTDANTTKNNILPGDLVIRDLGYYSMEVFKTFITKKAFFLSKLNLSTNIYDHKTEEKIDFNKLYKKMNKSNISLIDKTFKVGGGKTVLRVVIQVVPEKVYEQRIRNYRNRHRGTCKEPSKDYKARAHLNIMITNVENNILSATQLILAYRLRWQIELMFKNWKSICAIDKIQPMKYERYTCLLLTRLVTIILKTQIIWNIQYLLYANGKKKKLLSLFKCFKTIGDKFINIIKYRHINTEKIKYEICLLLELFSTNHWNEEKKNSMNYIDLIHCLSDDYNYL